MHIYKQSIHWISTFILWVLLTTFTQPLNAYVKEESSKYKYFGVGGWLLGKNCPNMELYWESKEEGNSNIFFRNPSGAIFKLPGGMAIFSPNCKYFWYTDYYEQKEFKIFSTKTGKSIIKIKGQYPAWSSDGELIYFFKTNKSSRQLWELNVAGKRENLIIAVQDFAPCFQQGDEVEWYPAIITKKGYILWNYYVKYDSVPDKSKKLIIDPKRKKIIKIEYNKRCLCSPFEKDN